MSERGKQRGSSQDGKRESERGGKFFLFIKWTKLRLRTIALCFNFRETNKQRTEEINKNSSVRFKSSSKTHTPREGEANKKLEKLEANGI